MSNRTKKARADALKKATGSSAFANTKTSQHITKISAKPANRAAESASEASTPVVTSLKVSQGGNIKANQGTNTPVAASRPELKTTKAEPRLTKTESKPTKTELKARKQAAKKAAKNTKNRNKDSKASADKPLKEVFILARPFVALGRYLRDSWREIRQVRWPNRKNTWKMTLAVLAYCAVFIVFIMLLDTFFTFLFKTFVK